MNNDDRVSERDKAQAWFDAGFSALGKRILRLGVLALVGYIAYRSHSIVVTLIMAGILACAASGPVDFLCRLRLFKFLKPHGRRALASALVLVTIVGLVFGAGALFLHPIQNELKNLRRDWPTKYQPELAKKMDETKHWYAAQPDWLHDLVTKQAPGWLTNLLTPPADDDDGLDPEAFLGIPSPTPQAATPTPSPSPAPAVTHVEAAAPTGGNNTNELLLGFLGKLGGLLNGVVELILLPVLAFYFLVEGHALRNELVRFVPTDKRRTTLALLRESAGIMQAYLFAQVILATIAGVFVGTMLGFAHIPYAVVLALVAAITRAVPVIGPLLGGIPVGLIVFVECSRQGNYTLLVVVMTLFTVMHLLESKALTPFILGKGLNLHPIVVIVALLIGGEFFGLLGMFLAAPVTALLRTILLHLYVNPKRTHFRNTSRLARALGKQKE
ncbi:AI-2E family transporter [Armatimonas rosea]|uniref:Putative PurR-regulated permease PerM n=1 Tax=Armatimonas rosea TaxID=685828 RepID=A0A7W9W6K3_ARMRO|nr:putative PurR-regulated permease PerM [Armatimonas rosea]